MYLQKFKKILNHCKFPEAPTKISRVEFSNRLRTMRKSRVKRKHNTLSTDQYFFFKIRSRKCYKGTKTNEEELSKLFVQTLNTNYPLQQSSV